MNRTPLFAEHSLSAVLHAQNERLGKRVAEVSAEDLLANPAAIEDELESDLRVNPLTLEESDITADTEEVKVDVSRDFDRMIVDPSRPYYVDGLRVKYFVPYVGDSPLWECQPSTSTTVYPRVAAIRSEELILEYDRADRDVPAADAEFKRDLALIKQYLEWAARDIEVYNGPLRQRISEALNQRRQLLQKGQGDVAALGYKQREKTDVPAPVMPLPPTKRTKTPAKARVQGATARSPARQFEYDVSLSYAGEDREYVEAVATPLKAEGIRVFYDKFEAGVLWGRNLIEHFAKIYGDGSRFIVLFISGAYASKAWPTFERRQALARAIREPQKVVILPVRLDDTPMPELSATHYVDGRATPAAELAVMIVDKIRREL